MHYVGIELRQHGITVNAYAPGVIDTTLRESSKISRKLLLSYTPLPVDSFADEGSNLKPAVAASKVNPNKTIKLVLNYFFFRNSASKWAYSPRARPR